MEGVAQRVGDSVTLCEANALLDVITEGDTLEVDDVQSVAVVEGDGDADIVSEPEEETDGEWVGEDDEVKDGEAVEDLVVDTDGENDSEPDALGEHDGGDPRPVTQQPLYVDPKHEHGVGAAAPAGQKFPCGHKTGETDPIGQ